ncbi:MAG: SLC13 family permease [Nitrosarchaeum sp.]|jgi:Na+/H+ antiporter NhaD/arsenite permease-like protein|uniref:SLC13 family permease n=1 Tax=Nitrosarchaeum sp. TaxID=2026886 RepID=UPI002DF5F000|nr:SLC13 family permease [Nitrosarchaeum sp.]MEC4848798.1 SLC13 family permease [Nitrosarchaeum sp.]
MDFDSNFFSILIVFVIVYGLIIFRNVRGINIPIWTSMTFGAITVLLLQIITPEDAFLAINFDVIFFLLGMFILVSGLESSGILNQMVTRILSFAKTPNQILFFILFVMGLLSAFLINDTIALVATPIVIGLAKPMNIRPAPMLICLAFGITIGSMMTPMGNPQNLLISLHSGMEFPLFTFLRYLFLPTITCLLVTFFILKWYYKKEFSSAVMLQSTSSKIVLDSSLAKKSSILTMITIIGFFVVGLIKLFGISTELNFSHVAIFGGLALLVIGNKRRQIVKGINWQIIVFFVAMFVFMQGVWNGGIIELFQTLVPFDQNPNSATASINIIGTSILTSQIVSNVPFVALSIPILQNYGFSAIDTIPWIALAAGSTIAGTLTILGAASNVIILETAERRHKVTFTFMEFFRIGIIVTAANSAILIFFITFPFL